MDFVAALADNTVRVELGNGAGSNMGISVPVAVGADPRDVLVGDFDGDGDQDLATVNYGSDDVTILLNNGSGVFSEASGIFSPAAVGDRPFHIASADIDGDGIKDLAVANYGSASVSILLGNGNGTFVPFPACGGSRQRANQRCAGRYQRRWQARFDDGRLRQRSHRSFEHERLLR